MKILTKEEEAEHYNATVTGGLLGGSLGAMVGGLGVYAASARYPAFRSLTIPFRAFVVVSTGTFSAIVSADAYSRRYEASRHPENSYADSQSRQAKELDAAKSTLVRAKQWANENRFGIVFGSWAASIAAALAIVGRNPYLTGQQKLVQARVYAQGLTMAVVIASLALEGSDAQQGKGRWQTVKVLDPNDPTHKHLIDKKVHHERYQGEDQWMDMVEAEETRLKERDEAVRAQEAKDKKKGKNPKHEDKDPDRGEVKKSSSANLP